MEAAGEILADILKSRNISPERSGRFKPLWEMTEDERRESAERRCTDSNNVPGNLNEQDGYHCDLCKNRGFSYVVEKRDGYYPDGTADFVEAHQPCKCKPVRASIMRMKRSGLEGVIKKYTFESFNVDSEYQKYTLQKAQQFLKNPAPMFYIGGASGSGKSHICTAIVAQFLREGKSAYYMLWQDEATRLKASIMDELAHEKQMNQLKTVDVLYIDDFFKPVIRDGILGRPSDADVRLAYELINYRYNNKGLITIISSERYASEIIDIDEATGGRIVEYAGEYLITIKREPGRNYRTRNIVEV